MLKLKKANKNSDSETKERTSDEKRAIERTARWSPNCLAMRHIPPARRSDGSYIVDYQMEEDFVSLFRKHFSDQNVQSPDRITLRHFMKNEFGLSDDECDWVTPPVFYEKLREYDLKLGKPANGISDTDAQTNVAKLEKLAPSLDKENGMWVSNKLAAKLENLKVTTLATYRKNGLKNPQGTFGRDQNGRVWRRIGTRGSHPWYLRSTLKSE